jgi:predicted dehydrogenase
MVSDLSIGILGAGFMGQTHGTRLISQEGVTIAAICDANLEVAKGLQQKLGGRTKVYDDFDQMIATTSLDALYVCIPPFAHSGQVEKAAKRGIHLFIEKPIAINLERAVNMAHAIDQAGVVSQVGYHNRFRKGLEEFRALLTTGVTGCPTLFQGRYWCNMLGGSWWRRKTGSNGQVFEQVIHIYDMAIYLFGEPASVSAFMGNLGHQNIRDYTIEDTSVSIIRFKNGSMASIVGSNNAMPAYYIGDYRVVCEKAVFDYRATGQEWVTPDTSTIFQYEGDTLHRKDFVEDRDVYLAETLEFLAAIRNEGSTRSPISAGLAGVRLVSAVLESADKGGAFVTL